MRVLAIGQTYVVEANRGKLAALARRGHEVAVFAPARWRSRGFGVSIGLQGSSQVTVFPAGIVRIGRGITHLYRPRALSAALRVFRPDVVHLDAELFAVVAGQVAAATAHRRLPLTLAVAETVERQLGPRGPLAKWVAGKVQHLFPIHRDALEICRRLGYTGPATILPQLGVDIDPQRPARTRAEHGTVGFVGRLTHQKGVDLLLRALAAIRAQGLNLRLRVVGSGPDEAALRAQAGALGVSEAVDWRGFIPHDAIVAELAQMDVLVLPSRTVAQNREQFGYVLAQAMAQGMPVLGSSCGAIPEVIGDRSVIFTEERWDELARLLEQMFANPSLYATQAERALVHACGFSNDTLAVAMERVWGQLVVERGD